MKNRAAAIYMTENITLYHADFFNISANMENGSVDMVFTDPPFELVGGGILKLWIQYETYCI